MVPARVKGAWEIVGISMRRSNLVLSLRGDKQGLMVSLIPYTGKLGVVRKRTNGSDEKLGCTCNSG